MFTRAVKVNVIYVLAYAHVPTGPVEVAVVKGNCQSS